MTEASYINDEGKLVIDMAAANELWNALPPLQRAEMTNLIFEPVMKNALLMRAALLEIITMCELERGHAEIAAVARDAIPK